MLLPAQLYLGNRSSTAVPDVVLPPPSMESCVALPPWSRTFLRLTSMDGRSRTSCASRHLHVQVQWRKCKGIVGRFCASRQLLPALLCLPTSLSVACARGISASLHVRTILALYIALPLGLGCLAPYAELNADRDEGRPEGVREGSRTSTRRDRMSLRGTR